jgi:hypothetical protein
MEHDKRYSIGQIGVGIFLLLVGVVLLLDKIDILNINILDNVSIWRLWPVIFMAIGISQLLNASSPREYHKGFWMIFLGIWFITSELHIFGLSYHNSWPILIIGIGLGILWKSFYNSHGITKEHCHGH